VNLMFVDYSFLLDFFHAKQYQKIGNWHPTLN